MTARVAERVLPSGIARRPRGPCPSEEGVRPDSGRTPPGPGSARALSHPVATMSPTRPDAPACGEDDVIREERYREEEP